MRWLRTVVAVAALAITGAATTAAPANAHASAQLPHAQLDSDGREVTVWWTAAPDDAADVGVALGLLPPEAVLAYLEGPTVGLPSVADEHALAEAPQLHRYLLDNITITQDGRDCAGRVRSTEDFLGQGATLSFTCPEQVDQAVVSITMLHDRDPQYRTFSVDGTEQFAVHTVDEPAHAWDFRASTTPSPFDPVLLVGLALALAAIAGGLWFVGRRRGDAGR